MKTPLAYLLVFAVIIFTDFSIYANSFRVIPLPNQIETLKEKGFTLNEKTKITYPKNNEKMARNAAFLSDYIFRQTGKKLSVVGNGDTKNSIVLKVGKLKSKNKEAYQLSVNEKNITIAGNSEAGVFYGMQTLRKATSLNSPKVCYDASIVTDVPRFDYRGIHLDVARHFFSVDFVKTYIDILAMHNVNTFHWHLTDDQGWRIEIKKYPKLTEIGSTREETVVGRNSGVFDKTPHGGYYTQEQIRDIVKYAQDRYITIIPEIDMPGHMLSALTAYPELGCTAGPYKVARQWGVFDEVLCPGKENTFRFLEDVFSEICTLFPSKYIHIGGDECPKTRWKTCEKCQLKIQNLGLKDDEKHSKEFYLQSYTMDRMEKYLNSKGKNIIGWDEILEGKIAPNATVMSWRGENGGIEAAKMKHNVIMTPNNYLYFDYYQTNDISNEPLAIGGLVPIEKVYHYDPIPKQLKPEEKKYILGVQANMWTEYILTPSQVEYMLLPRLAALSEVQWTQKESKNFTDFSTRLLEMVRLYDLYNYNYAKHFLDVQPSITHHREKKKIELQLSTFDNASIYYTTDGTEPTDQSMKYTQILEIDTSVNIKAKVIRNNGKKSRTYSEIIKINKASFHPLTLLTSPISRFTYGGAFALNDGILSKEDNFRNGRWVGFSNDGMIAIIDLEAPVEVSKVSIHTCVDTSVKFMDADKIDIAVSANGNNFIKVAGHETDTNDQFANRQGVVAHTVTFKPVIARYVKVTVSAQNKLIGRRHQSQNGYILVDEIGIE